MRLPGVILAGGRSSRMGGGDKGLRLLAGRAMIAHVIDRLTPQAGPLAINANGDPARWAGFGLPVLADPVPGYPGPLAGALAAMDWAAAQGAGAVVTVAADTPFFPADLVARLAHGAPFALGASVGADGRMHDHPTFGLWPVALRAPLRAALESGQRRVRDWAAAQGAVIVAFDAGPGGHDPFFNVNTPEDLAAAQLIAGP
ncbi:molybdenum cofactor guanylyltransferase MobA [Paracoccus sp. p4-l81]|uniref:molybdenum cofactor guanylyltransferase MobA n=1 Tax=Paracoccus sp. p4-l81 TaxID=3342806 RepID=UPI0035B9F26C